MTIIPVHSTQCSNSCSYCYYKFRAAPVSAPDPDWLISVTDMFDDVAVGLNNADNSVELAIIERRRRAGLPYRVMMRDNITIDYFLLRDICHGAEAVSISVGPATMDGKYEGLLMTNVLHNLVIVSLVTSDLSSSVAEYINRAEARVAAVHLICEKPDMICRTLDGIAQQYTMMYMLATNLLDVPVMPDACVPGTGYAPMCMSNTFEITSSKEVRLCPYMSRPAYTLGDSSAWSLKSARSPLCQLCNKTQRWGYG